MMDDNRKTAEDAFLASYRPEDYERPSVTTDVLIFTNEKDVLRILLIYRNEEPFKDFWAIPGSFVGMSETAEEAAERTAKKEAGVSRVELEQLYTFSRVDRDPRMRVISVAYIAMLPASKLIYRPGIRDGEAMLFDIDRSEEELRFVSTASDLKGRRIVLRKNRLAFDHYEMIRTAVDRMAGKIDYSDIAFRFLPEPKRFTLTELRHVYNAVKGSEADIPNFRRFIKNRYIITGKILNNHDEWEGHPHAGRPAGTYRVTEKIQK